MNKRDRLKPKHKRVKKPKEPLKLFAVHPKLYDAFVKYYAEGAKLWKLQS